MLNQEDNFQEYDEASSSQTSQERLSVLAKSLDTGIRSLVAENENTSPETLLGLSKDENELVLLCVAKNENTPVEALITLSNNNNEDIRQSVERHSAYQAHIKATYFTQSNGNDIEPGM